MAYDLIEKHKYPAYDTYAGVAQRGTFTMSFGHLISTGSVVDAIVEHFEEQAVIEGAVPLGLEVGELQRRRPLLARRAHARGP